MVDLRTEVKTETRNKKKRLGQNCNLLKTILLGGQLQKKVLW